MELLQQTRPGTAGFLLLCLGGLALLINWLTFAAFGLDKRRAKMGDWRLPERVLLLLALGGGWPGAKLAQHWYRHKTRKQPFRSLLNGIGVVHIGLIVGLTTPVVPMLAGLVPGDGSRFAEGSKWGADWLGAMLAPAPERRALPRRFGPGS
ncbi:MAG: DUF1294 domain-containing protein [Paracoccaceae bacterium]|nr:DUF1294 domain-containing protein [Paracoccaceae bacterium]